MIAGTDTRTHLSQFKRKRFLKKASENENCLQGHCHDDEKRSRSNYSAYHSFLEHLKTLLF